MRRTALALMLAAAAPRLRVALAALTVLALAAPVSACARKDAEPVAVAKQFAEASRRGDVEGMMAVLERPAVERLEQAAERASDQVGGRRSIAPEEMLQIVGVDRTIAVVDAKLVDQTDTLAHVEMKTTDGKTVRIELIWETAQNDASPDEGESTSTGAWKVRVPLPSSPAAPTTPSAQPDA